MRPEGAPPVEEDAPNDGWVQEFEDPDEAAVTMQVSPFFSKQLVRHLQAEAVRRCRRVCKRRP
jgi:hypothetical protein